MNNCPVSREICQQVLNSREMAQKAQKETLKSLWPGILILEHDFAQQANWRRAMAEHFVMELLKVEIRTFLLAIVFAELEDLQLAHGVIKVFGIVGASQGFLAGGFLLVVAVLHKEF